MDIEIVVGDITTIRADVVVTAANRSLVGGGGVDAAVHRAAGPELLLALRPLAPCPIGGAVITPAFDLDPPVAHIVHAVHRGLPLPAARGVPDQHRHAHADAHPRRALRLVAFDVETERFWRRALAEQASR